MPIFIALLRGINVGGNKKILMNDLKSALSDLPFRGLQTYLQSGNVIFEATDWTAERVGAEIETKIAARFGFTVSVVVRTLEELALAIAQNPWAGKAGFVPENLYYTFLSAFPSPALLEKPVAIAFDPDEYIVNGREIHLNYKGGSGNTKISNAFFERQLKTTATTRNWKTVNALFQIARELQKNGIV